MDSQERKPITEAEWVEMLSRLIPDGGFGSANELSAAVLRYHTEVEARGGSVDDEIDRILGLLMTLPDLVKEGSIPREQAAEINSAVQTAYGYQSSKRTIQ